MASHTPISNLEVKIPVMQTPAPGFEEEVVDGALTCHKDYTNMSPL